MHDDVARIDQGPIALCQSVDRTRAVACLLQMPRQMLGDGGNMAARTPACDDDGVGQRRAPFEVDRYNIFGLVVVERFQDSGEKRL